MANDAVRDGEGESETLRWASLECWTLGRDNRKGCEYIEGDYEKEEELLDGLN